MRTIALPGLRAAYEELGPPDGPPTVLLHGATETFRVSWKKLAPRLAEDRRVIGMDLRGHGGSGNPAGRLDLRTMADDLRDLLDALGVERADVVGFSGGASVTLFTALRHPARLRSMTLISNNFQRDEARLAAGFWDPERIRDKDPLWLDAMARWHRVPPETLLGWWDEEDRIRPAFAPEDLAGVRVPALVAGGDRDRIVPFGQTVKLFRALPDARLLILPGVGHGAPHRAPALLEAALRDFWASLTREAPPAHAPA